MSAADQVRRGPGTEVVVVANADSRLVGGPGAGAVAVRAIDQVAGSADRRVVRERGAPRPGRTLVVALFVVTGVAGLGVLVMGGQPKEGLHLVYAVVAVAAIPLAAWFVPAPDRRAGLVALAVFVVLGFILYRLFATG